jgi:hypothetical protein
MMNQGAYKHQGREGKAPENRQEDQPRCLFTFHLFPHL